MLKLPEDPMGQHNRLMLAVNDDLLAGDRNSPRAKAVCEIAQQMRAMPLRGRSGAVPAEPSCTVSGLRPPAAIAKGDA